MITGDQIIAHMIGDYVLQSDWMANEKTKKSVAALAHVLTYMLPFLFLTQDPLVLAVIVVSHFAIDRWRLARYVCWFKNFLSPRVTWGPWVPYVHTENEPAGAATLTHTREKFVWWHPWAECVGTGYNKDRPPWMAVWLMIIADNTLHILINGLALEYLR